MRSLLQTVRTATVFTTWIRLAGTNHCPAERGAMVHTKCRQEFYPLRTDQVARSQISDESVDWSHPCPDYSPKEFTAAFVLTAAWADAELGAEGFKPVWNCLGKNNSDTYLHS